MKILNFKEFLNESINSTTIEKIKNYIKDNSYFEFDDEDSTSLLFATRENGDVGAEKPSHIDIAEAERIANKLKNKFPDIKTIIDIVDEWVHLTIKFKKEDNDELENKKNVKIDGGIEGDYIINDNGEVDVNGRVSLSNYNNFMKTKTITKFLIKYGKISKDFDVRNCSLETLKNGPIEVGGSFRCNDNNLKNLIHGPKKVGEHYDCSNNNLTSLNGAPKKVKGYFSCANNKLKNLIGSPEEIGDDFICSGNLLISLEGCPKKINGDFFYSYFGTESEINSIKFTEEDVKKLCKVGGKIKILLKKK